MEIREYKEYVFSARKCGNYLEFLGIHGNQVSDEGDVLYVLPKDYRSNLTSKSLRMKYEPLLEKLKVSLSSYWQILCVNFPFAHIPHSRSE